MHKLAVLLALSGGCLGNGVVGSNAHFSRIDNRSNAVLVLVADANWSFGDKNDYDVTCASSPIDVVVIVVEDDALILTSTASLLGDDCSVSVRSKDIHDIVVPGDGPIEADGPCTDLKSLEVTGNGDVSLGTVEADVLDISVTGNGRLDITDLQADELVLHLTGNGDVTLAGAVGEGDFTIGGSGLLDASALVIETLSIVLSGSGDAMVNVTGSISGEITGDGSLDVLGAPAEQAVTVADTATGTLTYN
jgi:hypothetical protein